MTPFFQRHLTLNAPYFCSPVGTCTLAHFHIQHVQVIGVGVKNTFYSLSSCESKASASFKSFSLFLSFILFFRSSIKLHLTAKSKFSVIKKTFASHNHAH